MQNTLKKIPGFDTLPDAQMKRLAAKSETMSFKRGEILFRVGEKSEYAWFLISGKVSLGVTSPGGTQTSACIFQDQALFCCIPILDGGLHTVNAVCENPSVVARIPAKRLRSLLSEYPEAYKALVNSFCSRMRQIECRACLQAGSADEKVAEILRQHRAKYGAKFNLTRNDIAQLAGLTVETVIRVMAKLKKKGAISGSRGTIHVLKPESL